MQDWITAVGAKAAYITLGGPWENGFIESFNARLRDELLDGEIFYSLAEAKIVIESWRRNYNTARPHGSLGYKPPAPEVFVPTMAARATAKARPATPPSLAAINPPERPYFGALNNSRKRSTTGWGVAWISSTSFWISTPLTGSTSRPIFFASARNNGSFMVSSNARRRASTLS